MGRASSIAAEPVALASVILGGVTLVGPRQQYLARNPYGYRCHANTGVKFPETA